ncbi:MAG TPA: DUF72 domain-containing protein [Tepidisphaeraceae bacterium]|nr:DUF72 domain-containing protein [Tepidisphaeraceae bacterium]
MALLGQVDWRLGTMGFGYADWAGVFYPEGIKSSDYLEHYAKHFDAVELDTTFYATPPLERVQKWAEATPAEFRFSAKVPKAVTHETDLDRAAPAMIDFLRVMQRGMGEKLGLVLLQFPPGLGARDGMPKLEKLLRELPNDVELAAEFRHESWWNAQTTDLLKSYRVAWTSAEYVAEPRAIVPTTDLLYVRLIGEHGRIKLMNTVQIDVSANLRSWRDRLIAIDPPPKQIWVLFNNDYSGFAIETLRQFRSMIGLPQPKPPPEPGGLFER